MVLMKKYIGQKVEIIYMDKMGKITQRRIEVHHVKNGLVRATCLNTMAPRAFRIDSILACHPIKGGRHVS
jgi:predicted DNA-binding transcriptional regulator YafY